VQPASFRVGEREIFRGMVARRGNLRAVQLQERSNTLVDLESRS